VALAAVPRTHSREFGDPWDEVPPAVRYVETMARPVRQGRVADHNCVDLPVSFRLVSATSLEGRVCSRKKSKRERAVISPACRRGGIIQPALFRAALLLALVWSQISPPPSADSASAAAFNIGQNFIG
jgi:hypothetical protein